MRRFLGSSALATIIGCITVVVLAATSYVAVYKPFRERVQYCADMPDAVGLYPGNHVTIRGIPVGAVTRIEPGGPTVRVHFEVHADRQLRGEVLATTISDTLVADRNLAVTSTKRGTAAWDPTRCITRTFTPKSISTSLQAFSKVAEQMRGGDPAHFDASGRLVENVDAATVGTGPALNQLIVDLGTALRSPDAAIGRIGGLIDALSSLTSSMSANWGDIKSTLLSFGPGIAMMNSMWAQMTVVVDSILILFPWINRLTRKYGAPLLQTLDSVVPLVRMLNANVASLSSLVGMMPTLAAGFQRSVDRRTGRVTVSYAAPAVKLPLETSEALCVAVERIAPGRCSRTGGATKTDLIPLVMTLAGAS